jgi:hypothetical protein
MGYDEKDEDPHEPEMPNVSQFGQRKSDVVPEHPGRVKPIGPAGQ